MTYQDRLNEIRYKREAQFKILYAAQDCITELNTQRENIIMSEDEGDVEN